MIAAESAVQPPRGREWGFDARINAVAFTGDGVLAAALGDGSVNLIATDFSHAPVACHEGAALGLTLDVDGKAFVTCGDDGRVVRTSLDGRTSELFAQKGQQIDVIAVSQAAGIRAVATGREVHLLDAQGRPFGNAADHPSTIAGLAFNPKGKRLAVAHYGGVTLWWTATIGQSPAKLNWRGSHIGVSWSPDGSYVMTAMQECELHGWKVADGRDLAMRGYTAKVRSMSWAAKPMVLATSGADCVVAWPFAGTGPQGKPPVEVGQGLGRLVTQVAVHPNRPLVAAGFDDGGLTVSELVAGVENRSVRITDADGDGVTALVWSANGTRLAVGKQSGTLSIFDLS